MGIARTVGLGFESSSVSRGDPHSPKDEHVRNQNQQIDSATKGAKNNTNPNWSDVTSSVLVN